jgi:hypothetical protein
LRSAKPASSIADSAAATPNCKKRSKCLSSRLSNQVGAAAAQSLTSHENFDA